MITQKILVIDDDLFIRELYETVLKNKGFDVDTAPTGEEGLAKLQNGGYSLTLLDMRMPTLDGLGVLNELSKNPPTLKNGPIILLSNMGLDEQVKGGLEIGAHSFLVKADLTPDQLIENIKKYLSQ